MRFVKSLTILFLASVFLPSCETAQLANKQLAVPGSSILEVFWLEGVPNETKEGVLETLLVYPQYIDVIRNGKLSHRINSGTYGLSIDSIVSDSKTLKTYFISLSEEKSRDVYYQLYKQVIERSLGEIGLRQSATPNDADTLIDFDFSLAQEKETKIESETIPVTDYSWGTSTHTDLWGNSIRSSSATTSITHQQRIFSKTVIQYNRTLIVNFWAPNKTKQIARLTLRSSGQTSDLRQNFAALAAAATKFMDKDTQGEFVYLIGVNDPLISYVQGNIQALDHYKRSTNLLVGLNFNFTNKATQVQTNSAGDTIGTLVARSGSSFLVQALVRGGVSPNSVDKAGRSMLQHAIDTKSLAVVKTLLSLGADPMAHVPGDYQNENTVLDYAMHKGTGEIKTLFSGLEVKRTPAKSPF